MQLLWENEHLTAREIREKLYPDVTQSNHGTVQKLLFRLEQKGYVKRDRNHLVQVFYAEISRPEFAGRQLESLAERLTDGSLIPFITHLMNAKKISAKERQEIRDLLDD